MIFNLFLIMWLFLSCASQSMPKGGPVDLNGPSIIKSFPNNNSKLSNDESLIIYFDELIDPISIVNSIQIIPSTNINYKVLGKKLIITPKDKWPNSNIIKLKLSRKISDYQKNFMSEPLSLYFFNSLDINSKLIKGELFNSNNKVFEIGLYKVNEDNYSLIEKTQSNDNQNYEFKYLDDGYYFVAAVADSIVDLNHDISKRSYGMCTYSKLDLIKNDTIISNLRIDLPLERLEIKSFEQKNNFFGLINYKNGHQEKYFINELFDSLEISEYKKNRLEYYTTNMIKVKLQNIKDTIPPDIDFFKNDLSNYIISFSEPVKNRNDSTELFFYKDSIKNKIAHNFIDEFTLSFNWQKNFNAEVFIYNISDFYDNLVDSLKIDVEAFSNLHFEDTIGGNIFGSIIYDGSNSLIVEAINLDTNKSYYVLTDNKYNFSFTNLIPGFYKFDAYEFFGDYDSTAYFSGLWNPKKRAAMFGRYPDIIEIRKHWDIKDMKILVQ